MVNVILDTCSSNLGSDTAAADLRRSVSYSLIDHSPERVGTWMQALGAGYYRPGSTCIGLERDGQLVAGTMYDYCNGASIFCNIAIRGPITRKWLWAICSYPFDQLGCSVLIGLVASDNTKSKSFCRRFGFELEKEIHGADPSGSLLLFTMDREQCRFLKGRYANG